MTRKPSNTKAEQEGKVKGTSIIRWSNALKSVSCSRKPPQECFVGSVWKTEEYDQIFIVVPIFSLQWVITDTFSLLKKK